ncbi:hypothetical protein GLW04_13035 [Halobacillus litoralis]|uniref:Endospore appendages core domain-containing protein n=1 Tax=Halobacillus litoralis TaxID=45668 RepID=A0A845DTK7_9BACI|nr:S-Ena type endospore appendage [Halobacillus litoralis]MYL20820.1 hypothetical protein [Halobacillus litoralis]
MGNNFYAKCTQKIPMDKKKIDKKIDKVKNRQLCSQFDPSINLTVPASTEYTIFNPITFQGYNGMITIENSDFGVETTDTITVTFIPQPYGDFVPVTLQSGQSQTIPFENIREIKVRNNSTENFVSIDYEICVFLTDAEKERKHCR